MSSASPWNRLLPEGTPRGEIGPPAERQEARPAQPPCTDASQVRVSGPPGLPGLPCHPREPVSDLSSPRTPQSGPLSSFLHKFRVKTLSEALATSLLPSRIGTHKCIRATIQSLRRARFSSPRTPGRPCRAPPPCPRVTPHPQSLQVLPVPVCPFSIAMSLPKRRARLSPLDTSVRTMGGGGPGLS